MIIKLKTILGVLTFISFGMINSSSAQEENLVPNGSFETLEGKLKALGCIENAVGWTSPTGVRADIFTPTKTLTINTPENIYGKEEAKEGTNYAGITGFSYGDALPRSYLMTKLTTPLKKGMKYCVKFNLSLAEASKYSANQMGVLFSSKPFGTDSKTAILEKTHVLEATNKIFSATYNWEQVCGVYTADGGEKFLTLGNFTSNENTKNEKNKKDPKSKTPIIIAAYYYIDDVSVTLISEDFGCDCVSPVEEDGNYSTTIYQKVINLNDKMSPKEQIELQKEYFGFGKSSLSPVNIKSLDLIVALMKANADIKVEIFGHSDEMEEKVGKEKPMYSDLSIKRINEVMTYMTSKGIAEGRMIASPMNSSEESTEIGELDDEDLKMAKNRRITFKVR
jgi:OmpA-OmpF porin, OOP family